MGLENLRIAFSVLKRHRFRAFLTVLSIAMGSFSIVVVSSLAKSGLVSLTRNFEELGGARLLLVTSKTPERSSDKVGESWHGFSTKERAILFSDLPHVRATTTFSNLSRMDIHRASGSSMRADIVGSESTFLSAFGLRLAKGRMFTSDEDRGRARVCVVGKTIADTLFLGHALGQWLVVGPVRCRIVGQLADNHHTGVAFGFEWNKFIVLPIETASEISMDAVRFAQLYVRTDAPESNDIVKRVLNARLEALHRGIDDFQIWDFSGLMQQFANIFLSMRVLVGFLAAIALVVGGIGIMNIMLVNVFERVREIGIRKAIGASPRVIQVQFLCEAGILSGAGGCVGVIFGAAVALIANAILAHFEPKWMGSLSFGAIVIALVVAIAIGLVFGVAPARRAARLDPVVGMRGT